MEQEFNSLDAQRESAHAYIKSQAGEGWRSLKTHYDDGGYSGGNLQRPALGTLLADIRAGRVDVVVVYKVDRLTRSLSDFAKLVEVFEAHAVSFVSVTQQFNTTTSMGRLMLNVLLSFAQFEREVTGERIRDKIAASKKKGMWMGGFPPVGYDARDRKLLVNEGEARVVRHIFSRYIELACLSTLVRELNEQGYRTKTYISESGNTHGNCCFSRGHVHRILKGRIYLGEVVHRGACYPGEHEAIVTPELWDKAQALLSTNRNGLRTNVTVASGLLLKGLVFDDAGNRMSPARARKDERRYGYYVSQALIQNRGEAAGSLPRVPAYELEQPVIGAVGKWLVDQGFSGPGADGFERVDEAQRRGLIRGVLRKVVVSQDELRIELQAPIDGETNGCMEGTAEHDASTLTVLRIPFELVKRGRPTRLLVPDKHATAFSRSDPVLISALARAWSWRERLLNGESVSLRELAQQSALTRPYLARIVRLAFLVPDLIEAILEGRNSPRLTLERLRRPIPLDWAEQRRLFGGIAR